MIIRLGRMEDVAVVGMFMWIAQVATLNLELFKSQPFLMAREELLFWLPNYNGKFCISAAPIFFEKISSPHCRWSRPGYPINFDPSLIL